MEIACRLSPQTSGSACATTHISGGSQGRADHVRLSFLTSCPSCLLFLHLSLLSTFAASVPSVPHQIFLPHVTILFNMMVSILNNRILNLNFITFASVVRRAPAYSE